MLSPLTHALGRRRPLYLLSITAQCPTFFLPDWPRRSNALAIPFDPYCSHRENQLPHIGTDLADLDSIVNSSSPKPNLSWSFIIYCVDAREID